VCLTLTQDTLATSDNGEVSVECLTVAMAPSAGVRITFARLCRETRLMLDISQRELADTVGVSRPTIASIESGRANPSLDLVSRVADALGLELDLIGRPPLMVSGPWQRDIVHARCSGYVDRRLSALGWQTRRETTVVGGRYRGWIDILAFDPRRRILLVVEIKTWLEDLGAVERQLDWYVREAPTLVPGAGIRPIQTVGWLLTLASTQVDDAIRRNRDALRAGFPDRAIDMRALLAGDEAPVRSRGLALIDPRSRRREWLIPSRADGRRSAAPYADYAAAARTMSA
jgi:DNA-binding XRE family transcriptional regulator